MVQVEGGTIAVYSDIACPWSHLAVHRLWEARARAGAEQDLSFDHRAFPLELFNERATPKRTLDAEVRVLGEHAPEAGWKEWAGPPHDYPVSSLLALEAVQAAKEQGLRASEALDRALRRAFFRDSLNITMRHVILAAAEELSDVDADALAAALDDGRARRAVIDQKRFAEGDEVRGSPHVFLASGGDFHNPGVKLHWQDGEDGGFPVIEKDDSSVYDELIEKANSDHLGG